MRQRPPSLGATLDLWFERLDAEDFQVGIRERLIAQDFLTRLAAAGELPASRQAILELLAPLICTTPDSQRRYAALLQAFLAIQPKRRGERHARSGGERQAGEPPPRWRMVAPAILAILLLVLAGLGSWYWVTQPPVSPPIKDSPPVPGPKSEKPPDEPPPLEIYRPPAPAEAAPATPASRTLAHAYWLLAGLAALALAWAAWTRLRRKLYLQGTRSDARIEEHVLSDPHAGRIEPHSAPIRAASRGLRQRIAGEREVLDLRATLAATLKAAGAFSPRYRRLRHTPEYLALIDRRHPGDHLADYAEALIKALVEHGVTVQVFNFEGTPAHGCWRPRQGPASREAYDRRGMAELAARYGGHRLLVFAEAEALVDPLSGGTRPWARQLDVFRQRAWFTPMPLQSWSSAEAAADARGFLVLPMPAEALTTLAGWLSSGDLALAAEADWPLAYPALLEDQALAWVARGVAPPADMLEDLLFQLRAYLGAARHQWLCACAIFPALSPPLTLALGKALNLATRDLALGIATLGALPWFRQGHMPAWLRVALLAELSPENRSRAQQVVEQRLGSALQGGSGSELVRVATRRKLWAWLGRGTGVARDVVLVDVLRKDGLTHLAQSLPEALRRRLFRNGLAAQGLRPALLAGLGGVCALSLGLAVHPGFAPSPRGVDSPPIAEPEQIAEPVPVEAPVQVDEPRQVDEPGQVSIPGQVTGEAAPVEPAKRIEARGVQVPRLTGLSLKQARDMLAKLGLGVRHIELTAPSRAMPGTVLEQKPAAGGTLAPGGVVTLGVAAAPVVARSGWCCILGVASQRQQGGVFALGEKECAARDGLYFASEEKAQSECARFAGLDRQSPVQNQLAD